MSIQWIMSTPQCRLFYCFIASIYDVVDVLLECELAIEYITPKNLVSVTIGSGCVPRFGCVFACCFACTLFLWKSVPTVFVVEIFIPQSTVHLFRLSK